MVNWSTAREILEQGPQGSILNHHNAEVWVNSYTSQTLPSLQDKVTTPPTDKLAGPSESISDSLLKNLTALDMVSNHIFGSDPKPARVYSCLHSEAFPSARSMGK